ncbi:MAG: 4Fe-4S binding protein [Thermoleophilia bacterium]
MAAAASPTPGTPVVDRDRCKGCGLCVEFCPFGHLHLDEALNVAGYHPAGPEAAEEALAEVHPDEAHGAAVEVEGYEHNFGYWCLRCRYCEIVCPDAAIRLAGEVAGLEGTPGYDGDWGEDEGVAPTARRGHVGGGRDHGGGDRDA